MSLGFTSCNQDNIGPKFEGDLNRAVAFVEHSIAGEIDPENTVIPVECYRISAEGDQTVNVICESEFDGISVDPSVTFKDGEYEAVMYVKVTDIDKLDDMKKYSVVLRFANNETLPTDYYGTTVKIQIKPSPFGTADYNPWLFTGSWDVDVLKAKSGNYFRLLEPIEEGYNFEFTLNDDASELDIEVQETGFEYGNYGMVYWVPTGAFEYTPSTHSLMIAMDYEVSAGSFGSGVDEIIFDKDILNPNPSK